LLTQPFLPDPRAVGQATPNNALRRHVGALLVVNSELDPMVVPKIELGAISVEMLVGTRSFG
jgi:hypothetical protein